jgi:hypothetical protein
MESLKSLSTKEKDKTTTVEVEKIDNGFLIIERTEWTDPKKGWMHTTNKKYSETNPLKGIKL